MKIRLPNLHARQLLGLAVFAAAAALCFWLSIWTVNGIERHSRLGVQRALDAAGNSWVEVETEGLQVILSGTAATEAARFRALSIAGGVVDSARLIDAMSVVDQEGLAPPEFKLEVLRNDDGISLIGLAPAALDRADLMSRLSDATGDSRITDLLELSDHPVPAAWDATVRFAVEALGLLPRSKVSVTPGHVTVVAIADSAAQKAQQEDRLRQSVPRGVTLDMAISAPRPVIAPFTLRFILDEKGARFDACSADSDRARTAILAAAVAVGANADSTCTIGLGVPTPDWTKATVMAITALGRLGSGMVTFSDTDIALAIGPEVSQADLDAVVGDLESNLPGVFALTASRSEGAVAGDSTGIEFRATVDAEGKVDLVGRVRDELAREVVEGFARARFGTDAVHSAMRVDDGVPEGWTKRVLIAIEVLGELDRGEAVVRPAEIAITGIAGSRETQGEVARVLSGQLGAGGAYDIDVTYEASIDPVAAKPSAEVCIGRIDDILAGAKIAFEPGSAIITREANTTVDAIAEVLRECSDYPMEIGGHTDAQGSEEMNLALSEQRARAVIVALQARRILTGNLTARGYGEGSPVMANDTEENRDRNRRIEFKLVLPPAEGEAVTVTVKTPDDDTLRPKPRPAGGGND